MTFTAENYLVQFWARKVREGATTRENVPKLFNLQEVVYQVLDSVA